MVDEKMSLMIGADDGDEIELYGGHVIAESIMPRNQPLIAAAPEMYEALKGALWLTEHPAVHSMFRDDHAQYERLADLAKQLRQLEIKISLPGER